MDINNQVFEMERGLYMTGIESWTSVGSQLVFHA